MLSASDAARGVGLDPYFTACSKHREPPPWVKVDTAGGHVEVPAAQAAGFPQARDAPCLPRTEGEPGLRRTAGGSHCLGKGLPRMFFPPVLCRVWPDEHGFLKGALWVPVPWGRRAGQLSPGFPDESSAGECSLLIRCT